MKEKRRYNTLEEATIAFDQVDKGLIARAKDKILEGAKWILPSVTAGAVIGGFSVLVALSANREENPSLKELLTPQEYELFSNGTIENLGPRDNWNRINILGRLGPELDYARNHLHEVEQSGKFPRVDKFVDTVRARYGMDPRLVSSWLRASYLHDNFEGLYIKEEDLRLFPGYVPKKFAEDSQLKDHHLNEQLRAESIPDDGRLMMGALYLKHCIDTEAPVHQTFLRYFSNNVDIASARTRTATSNYFLGGIGTQETIDPYPKHFVYEPTPKGGFGKRLPYPVQRLTDTATALYLATDESGKNIDFDYFKNMTEENR